MNELTQFFAAGDLSRMVDREAQLSHFTLTATGLEVQEKPSFEEYQAVGDNIARTKLRAGGPLTGSLTASRARTGRTNSAKRSTPRNTPKRRSNNIDMWRKTCLRQDDLTA